MQTVTGRRKQSRLKADPTFELIQIDFLLRTQWYRGVSAKFFSVKQTVNNWYKKQGKYGGNANQNDCDGHGRRGISAPFPRPIAMG